MKSKGLGVLGGVPKSTRACCLTEAFFVDGAESSKGTSATWMRNAAKAIAEGIEAFWSSKQASLALYGDDLEDEWPAMPYLESVDLAGHHDDH